MMKRLLCIFLILSLLVVYVPAVSAEESQSIPYSLLENAAKKVSEEASISKYPATRGTLYSYGIPAPLSEGQAAVTGKRLPIRYVMVENGGSNQVMYTLIYQGDSSILDDPDFDGEPIAYGSKAFTTETTLREYTAWFDTTGCKTGAYTVLSFTMVNNSQLVEDSATYTEIYIVDKEIPLQGYTLTDAETGLQVKEINLTYQENRTYTIGRIPAITTDTSELDVYWDRATAVEMEVYHGLFMFYGEGLGSSVLNIDSGAAKFSLPVNVCFENAPHKYQAERVRDASKTVEGSTIYCCENCYYTYVEYDHNLTAVFNSFKDIGKNEWYTAEVKKAVEMGLFNGLSADRFGPQGTMTRAMLVTVLWRYAGKPTAEKVADFTDVPKGQWYSDAVSWAAEKGIVTGVGKGRFSPDGTITREQMATILYRYASGLGIDTGARGDLNQFADVDTISSWAEEALQWAVAEGIMGGSLTGGVLSVLPSDGATRAQVAAVLVRTIEKLLTTSYEISIPDCAVKAHGATAGQIWTLYEDGTLVVELNRDGVPASGSWTAYKNEIITLKIMDGIEHVGSFKGLTALKEVILADSVTSISPEAFKNCTALETIRFPEGLSYIEYSAFENCTSLKNIELPKELCYLDWACFANCTALTEIRLPDGFRLNNYSGMNGQGSFKGCTSLEKVVLGKGSSTVSMHMFYGCTSLTTVEFADGILGLSAGAFGECTALEEIVLPEQLQYFQDDAFAQCANLKKVTILNPCLRLVGYATDSNGNPAYNTPFPEGCEIYGYAGSSAQVLAETFGYTFHPIGE